MSLPRYRLVVSVLAAVIIMLQAAEESPVERFEPWAVAATFVLLVLTTVVALFGWWRKNRANTRGMTAKFDTAPSGQYRLTLLGVPDKVEQLMPLIREDKVAKAHSLGIRGNFPSGDGKVEFFFDTAHPAISVGKDVFVEVVADFLDQSHRTIFRKWVKGPLA